MAAPVAPAAGGAIALAGVTAAMVTLLFMWMTLYGMQQGYVYSLGALLRWFARLVGKVPLAGGAIAGVIDAVDDRVRDAIAAGLQALDRRIALLWDGLTWIVQETYNAMVAFGFDVYSALETVIRADIPAVVAAGPAQLARLVGRLRVELWAAKRDLSARMDGLAAEIARDLDLTFGKARAGIDALRGDIVAALARKAAAAAAAVAALRRYVRGALTERMGALERRLAGLLAGAVAIAGLTRVFPWWQCRNVRGFNRALCRSPVTDWAALLGLFAFGLVALNPERVVQLAEDAADALSEVIATMAGK